MTRRSPHIAPPFYCFDTSGERDFPSPSEVSGSAKNGVVVTIFADANVCLLLSNYTRNCLNEEEHTRISQFLLTAEFTKVDIAPFFGCLELASNRHNPSLNQDVLLSISKNVKAAIHQHESGIVYRRRPYVDNELLLDENESIEAIFPFLRMLYACHLKIAALAAKGKKKHHAVPHLKEFFEWCEHFRIHVSIVNQAALAIFGGAPDAQTLLGKRKNKTIFDVAWATTWDTFHGWFIQNYLPFSKIDDCPQKVIFVTNDKAAAYIAGMCSSRAFFLNKGTPFLSAFKVYLDFPHFSDQIEVVQEICREKRVVQEQRYLREFPNNLIDMEKVNTEISHLEKILQHQQDIPIR